MSKWKIFALLFTVFSIGAIQESVRIFTSTDPDIAGNRADLIPMAIILTSVFMALAVVFWIKASKKNH